MKPTGIGRPNISIAAASSILAPTATIIPCRSPRTSTISAGTAPGRKNATPTPSSGSKPSRPVIRTAPTGLPASHCASDRFIVVRSPATAPRGRPDHPRNAGSVLVRVREQREETSPLHRERQLALIVRPRAGDAARDDLARLGDVALQRGEILVIDPLDAFGREFAELTA